MKLAPMLIAAVAAGPAFAQSASDPGDPDAGGKFAQEICSDCHIVANGQAEPGRIDAPTFFEIASDPSTTAFSLRAYLRTPHYAMPNIILSPTETDNVVSYILSLKGQ